MAAVHSYAAEKGMIDADIVGKQNDRGGEEEGEERGVRRNYPRMDLLFQFYIYVLLFFVSYYPFTRFI